jgi:site-specific recombinase XerD
MLIEGKSKKTIERYKLAIDMLLEFFNEKNVKEITTNDLRYYLALYQQQRKVSGTTLDGMRRVFSAFFNWLEQEDYIYKSPARRVARIKKDTKKERELYESEIEMLAQACTTIRDRALIEFMYATAARVSEVAGINREEVDFEKRSVLLHGKGGKDRIAYFTDKAALFLRQYLEQREDDNEALFVSLKNHNTRVTKESIEQMVRILGNRSGVTGIHPHRFRVTRITVLVNRGMPLQDVQVIAGHASINTTQMYYRANGEKVRFEYNKVA